MKYEEWIKYEEARLAQLEEKKRRKKTKRPIMIVYPKTSKQRKKYPPIQPHV